VPRDWEQHYAQAENLDLTPSPLVVEAAELIAPGRALDLACGSGRNALYLAGLGWTVVAVDSSPAAIRVLRARSDAAGLPIEARVADLEAGAFAIEARAYDLICDFFYLQYDLFPPIREGVRPGGLFAAQIHLRDDQPHRFVLEPGELRRFMKGWTILHYSEAVRAGHNRPSASILARRASPLSPQTGGGDATTDQNINRPRKHDRE
jgi:tellurite methyltransferase